MARLLEGSSIRIDAAAGAPPGRRFQPMPQRFGASVAAARAGPAKVGEKS
jgi:hypothetical protein